MTSIAIDRSDGLSSAVAIKGPCRVATTANITLSGTQTIDGVTVAVADRVLVKDQTTGSENGIYVVDTGPWRRAKDFSRTKDVVTGTLIVIISGTVNSGRIYQLSTTGTIIVGTTSIAFVRASIGPSDLLGIAPTVETFSALVANTDTTANLALDGYSGTFKQVTLTDYSALVSADATTHDSVIGYEIIRASSGSPSLGYLRQRKTGDLVKVSEAGGDIQRALNIAAQNATLLGGTSRVTVEQNWVGTKTISSGLIIPANVDFVPMTSSGKSVISAGALAATALVKTDGTIGAGGRYALFAGTPADSAHSVLPAFNAISKGDTTVTFTSAHGLVIGDWFKVWKEADNSWTAARTYYKMGFEARVVGVNGNTIHLSRAFRDAYTYSAGAPVVRAYKKTTRKLKIGFDLDLASQAVSDGGGAFLSCIADSEIYDMSVKEGLYSAIHIDQCSDLVLRSTVCETQYAVGGTGNGYGLLITNSSGIKTYAPKLFSPWHAYSLGGETRTGNIQNYDVVLFDCEPISNGSTTAHSCDIHGNADACGFVRVKANGLSWNGRDPFIDGCDVIVHPGATVADRALIATEIYGGQYRCTNSNFYSVQNSGTSTSIAGAIKMVLDSTVITEPQFTFDNCNIDMPNEQSPVHIQNGASTAVPYSYAFRGGRASIPSSSFGLGYLGNAGAVGSSGEFLEVWPTSLTVGKPYASNPSGLTLFTRQSFKPQVLLKNYTPTVTTNYTAATETLDHGFPVGYTPRATATLQSGAAGAKGFTRMFSVTATQVRVSIATGDATNLTAAAVDVAVIAQ